VCISSPLLCKPKYHFDDFLSFLFNFRLHFSPRDHVPNLLNLRAPQWRQCMNGDLVCTLQCVVDYRVADTFLSRRSYYRVLFKLAVTVHQCLNGRAPPYLSDHCIPVSSADTRRHLRSANRHVLAVPRFRLNTYGRRTFSVAGPMAWNSLPDFIRDPTSSTHCFRRLLKTYLFARF